MDEEEQGDQRIPRKDLEKENASNGLQTGVRWREQPEIELDGKEWSVAYAPQRVSTVKA